MFIFVILAVTYAALLGYEMVTGKPVFPRVSRLFGLKYKNSSGDTYTGTLDQRTYTQWKGVKVVKQKVAHMSNPASEKQAYIRSLVERFSKEWGALTSDKKALWTALGNDPVQPNPEAGIRAIIRRRTSSATGLNEFVAYNIRAQECGALASITLPDVHHPPVVNSTFAIAWTPSGTLHATWTDENGSLVTAYVAIWGYFTNQNIGHKQLLGVVLSSEEELDIAGFTGANGALIPFSDVIGAGMLIQYEVIDNATGYFSVPSNTIETKVA